jgi:ABC-type transport system involved in multi-copper enzyme maturation permease subunit
MKMVAEENRLGTIELLTTKDITDGQIIRGKFFCMFNFDTHLIDLYTSVLYNY